MRHSFASRRFATYCLLIAAAIAVAACGMRQESTKVPLAQSRAADSIREVEAAHGLIGPEAKAALDRGNALFRKKAYSEALAEYRAASTLAPQNAAPLFGIYMVARATNNVAMADSALAGIRLRNGSMTPAPHSLDDSALRRMHDSLRKRSTTG